MPVRGIRGATTVAHDQRDDVLAATRQLLEQMQAANALDLADIAAVYFTATGDIKSVYPARAARDLGWEQVPLLCFQEMEVEAALPLCIRILILCNTELSQAQIKHVYLREAEILRPDLTASRSLNGLPDQA